MGEHTSVPAGSGGSRSHRAVRAAVAAAFLVASGCAVLLVAGHSRSAATPEASGCGALCDPAPTAPGSADPGAQVPPPGEQHQGRDVPGSAATPPQGPSQGPSSGTGTKAGTANGSPPGTPSPASASSAPVPAGVVVKFKVTSHWDTGYRAELIVVNNGSAAISGWRVAFHVSGATLHQPTDTGEATMAGQVVTVDPAAWHATVDAGSQVSFGLGFDGTLAEPTGCLFDDTPCTLQIVAS